MTGHIGGIAVASDSRIDFEVLLDARPVGTHSFHIRHAADGTCRVRSEAAYAVKLLGIVVCRFRHQAAGFELVPDSVVLASPGSLHPHLPYAVDTGKSSTEGGPSIVSVSKIWDLPALGSTKAAVDRFSSTHQNTCTGSAWLYRDAMRSVWMESDGVKAWLEKMSRLK